MNYKQHAELLIKAGAMSIITKCSMLFKMSYIVGSYAAWFGASSVVAPLAGAFGGTVLALSAGLVSVLISYSFGHLSLFTLGAYHLPGMCAALYLSSNRIAVRVVLPLICMALFMAHPVGAQAFVYSLYWIIPVAVHYAHSKNFWLNACGATFVAHAVGSTMWLYMVPMAPAVWMGLIPVVIVERLAYATGMYVVYHAVMKVMSMLRRAGVVRRFVTVS